MSSVKLCNPKKRKRDANGSSRVPVVSIPAYSVACSICQQVMHDPAGLECTCRRSFCYLCISTWQKKNDSCPLCKGEIDRDVPLRRGPPEWSEALDSIKRSCPNNQTCRFRRGSFHEAREHALNDCSFRKVVCPNEACDEVLEQRQSVERTHAPLSS